MDFVYSPASNSEAQSQAPQKDGADQDEAGVSGQASQLARKDTRAYQEQASTSFGGGGGLIG